MVTIPEGFGQAETPISAAILAGGASRRMGRDKALLDWDGRPLVEHVVSRVRSLGSLVDDVKVVGFRNAYEVQHASMVEDDYPGTGALGGVATALRAALREWVLVVACDMPLLNIRLLRAMIALTEIRDGAIVPVLNADRSRQGGRQTFETLHAIYPRSCLAEFTSHLTAGNLKIADVLADIPVCGLDEAWIREYDPDLMSFFNANTPEQFAAARAYIRRSGDRDRE